MKMKSAFAKRWLGAAMGTVLALGATTASAVTVSVNVVGSIGDASSASNDVDNHAIVMNAGDRVDVQISYEGLWNVNDVNPVMVLYMEDGGNYYAVASTDPDSFGTSFEFTAFQSGNYLLQVTADFNQGVDAFGNLASTPGFQSDANGLGTANAGNLGASFTSFNYSVTNVPVPAAAWLFGSGLVAMGAAARRRKAK